jgi:hypothetical protein
LPLLFYITMPRAAAPKKATAAKPKKPKAKKATAKEVAAPRRRATLQPASGETLKQNATQLEVAERMLAEIASREQAETDPAVAAQRALRAAIVSGAIPAGATILKPAPALKSQSEIDAEARLAADKAAADAAKAANKRARDSARATEIATELARLMPAPVVMTGAPVYAPGLAAPAPAPAPAPATGADSWLRAMSSAFTPSLFPTPSIPSTSAAPAAAPSAARVRKTAAEKEAKRQREATRLATALATALAAAGVSGATSGIPAAPASAPRPAVATGASVAGPSGPPLPPPGPPPPAAAKPAGPSFDRGALAAEAAAASKKLKKLTPEEIAASDAARAAKAAAAAPKAGTTPKIKKFASYSAPGATPNDIARNQRLQVWRGEALIAYNKGGIPITRDLLMEGPGGASDWPVENDAAIAAAVAAKSGVPGTSASAAGTSASASIGTDTGVEDPTAKKAVLNADGTLFKKYNWDSRKLKQLLKDKIVQVGADGRLYRRSADEINAEREAIAAATAAPLPKVGPSTVLSEAETAVAALPTPASPPRLTDAEVDALLEGEGRGKHSEIQAVGFPQDSWTPAQARKWLKDHDAVPIKGMRREGSWLRWRITPPDRYSRYTTKTLRSNGKAVHLVMGWR